MAKKEVYCINTNPFWDEMSAIAQEAVSDIERVLGEVEVDSIPTTYGKVYNDKEEDEAYILIDDDEDNDPQPLRELDTQEILYIADDINEWLNKYNKKK